MNILYLAIGIKILKIKVFETLILILFIYFNIIVCKKLLYYFLNYGYTNISKMYQFSDKKNRAGILEKRAFSIANSF